MEYLGFGKDYVAETQEIPYNNAVWSAQNDAFYCPVTGNDKIVCISEKIIFVINKAESHKNVRVKNTWQILCSQLNNKFSNKMG